MLAQLTSAADPIITIGSKNFTESVILGELATLLVREEGLAARHRTALGGTRIVFNALAAGDIDAYAPTAPGTLFDGTSATVALDRKGNEITNVWVDGSGDYWLRSRLTGNVHYLPQTRDTVVDNAKVIRYFASN